MAQNETGSVQAVPAGWTRLHAFDAISNFRDFGGYPTDGGRSVVTRRLFRAANQALATDADLTRLAALGLEVVVDLRRPTERAGQPSRRPADWLAQVIENDFGDEAEPPHLTFLRQGDVSPATIESYLQGYYRAALFEERHTDLFTRCFAALKTLDGAILIHCAAGKDRTGLLVALIQLALGVHRDDVIADYLLTNATSLVADRMETVRKSLTEGLGREVPEAAVRAFLGVEARYLDTALRIATERCGSIDNYLRELGVSEADQRALVQRFTN
ncbi:tyrosine-protein phosphatase [Chelatococcus reniformis]|uniref:Protein-tyrosine-phosphatase n=1 Tax=Chelatococcus reniformis TaxID=1494448 RepID=A0A916UCL2_9HYPH|nr:tyrosine-protein phosphatase [Chelatococcus reniformis]GGC67438.1 protein-tyrosine-phosphatase [Chelatococcus reniformis]